MDLRQLTTFYVLATTLNFHQTAARLNYVQSTVSAQIQALEEEFGVCLFDRLGRRVVLTDAGTRLLPYAKQMLHIAEEARLAITDDHKLIGTLTIGAPETLCTYRLPDVLHKFRTTYPQVRLLFNPMPCEELRRAVRDGSVDLVFVMEEPVSDSMLQVEPLISETIQLIASPHHPLAQRTAILPGDLEQETVLFAEAGCPYRLHLQHLLRAAGIQPLSTLEFDSVEAIKQCVMVGIGVAMLPEVAIAAEREQSKLAILPWAGEQIVLVTQMLWHKQKWMSPALQAFLTIARETLLRSQERQADGRGEEDEKEDRHISVASVP
ncbi:LysR family transcriptional regulator [Ktedonosporobacter rubrisoli]|uniref:LysR family transcriptional regulator n=1 Tax=Ktedonosporobacter rubrisoli TaxID=2509675 RepID=A0A4P6JQ26_KTERU|nr:LysR family transcriptional regulator [Ktedonosporobacter rubrisoli]QBD77507.1 LysR family transcriptional regulator [Ktedonosporobacter rubrisoli]